MPRKGWASVSLTVEMLDEIDRFLSSEKGKKLGFHSRADIITRAVTDLIEKYQPRFEHLNMMDDNVKIVDFTMNLIATVYFKNGGEVYCDLCESQDCEHIDYALAQPDVQEELEKHDWVRRQPRRDRE